jgi:hypothetical protein
MLGAVDSSSSACVLGALAAAAGVAAVAEGSGTRTGQPIRAELGVYAGLCLLPWVCQEGECWAQLGVVW